MYISMFFILQDMFLSNVIIIPVTTVKHVYFASIKFSRISRFEKNREIKYTQIIRIAHHHDFDSIEYQLFHDMICSILSRFNVNNNTGQISIITFEVPKEIGNKLLDKINWTMREIKMQQIFYIMKLRN